MAGATARRVEAEARGRRPRQRWEARVRPRPESVSARGVRAGMSLVILLVLCADAGWSPVLIRFMDTMTTVRRTTSRVEATNSSVSVMPSVVPDPPTVIVDPCRKRRAVGLRVGRSVTQGRERVMRMAPRPDRAGSKEYRGRWASCTVSGMLTELALTVKVVGWRGGGRSHVDRVGVVAEGDGGFGQPVGVGDRQGVLVSVGGRMRWT